MERRYFDEKKTDFNSIDFMRGGDHVDSVHGLAN